MSLRVGIVAPLEIRVPPVDYGGTELVVSLLTEELVRRGHEVTLFASGDSITNAKLVSITPEYLRKSETRSPFLSLLNVVACYEKAGEFDIIHNHTMFEGMTMANLIETPVLTTFHGALVKEWMPAFMRYRGWYNTISKSAKELLPPKGNFAGVVYNAIDPFAYTFNSGEHSKFLLFLSRFSPEKGPHIAIKVAKKLKIPLVMAGNIHPNDEDYFERRIRPFVDGKTIICEGEISDQRKKKLLSEAKCLLAPIAWPEPFGLFMVEAMACGTPVVAFNQGSVMEVVRDGVTGYVIKTFRQMVEAVKRLDEISPMDCRQHVLDNFDAPVLANNYFRAYERIISQSKTIEQRQLALR